MPSPLKATLTPIKQDAGSDKRRRSPTPLPFLNDAVVSKDYYSVLIAGKWCSSLPEQLQLIDNVATANSKACKLTAKLFRQISDYLANQALNEISSTRNRVKMKVVVDFTDDGRLRVYAGNGGSESR